MKKRASLKTQVTGGEQLLHNSSEDLDSTTGVAEFNEKSKPSKKFKKKGALFSKQHAAFLQLCDKQAQKMSGQVAGKRLPGKTVPRPPTPPLSKIPDDSVTVTGMSGNVQSDSGPINRKYDKSNFKRGHLIGTKEEVWTGLRYKTSGGLHYEDLMKNKSGKIVSKVQSERGLTLGIKNLIPAQPKQGKKESTSKV
jgi:hypothetical protein